MQLPFLLLGNYYSTKNPLPIWDKNTPSVFKMSALPISILSPSADINIFILQLPYLQSQIT